MKYLILLLALVLQLSAELTNATLDGVTNATINGKLDDDAAASRTALGLGTAATADLSNILGQRSYAILPTNLTTHYYCRIFYKAVEYGVGANDITVAHVISGGGSTASVAVVGRSITVTAGSTCTAETLIAAVNAHAPAAELVTASVVGSQTGGPVIAAASTPLRSTIEHDAKGSVIIGKNNGTGSEESNVTLYDGPGNIVFQDMGVFGALKPNATAATIKDGTGWIFRMRPWMSHGGSVGARVPETTWDIDGSIAIIPSTRTQYGNNSSGRDTAYFQFVSGTPTVDDPLRRSRAQTMQSKWYSGGSVYTESIGWQSKPQADGANMSILYMDQANTLGDQGATAGTSTTTGDLYGREIAEMTYNGTWNRGIAPEFSLLTPGATITQVCSKFKTIQSAIVTLGQASTLDISGELSGMRGIVYVIQPSTGGPYTLTLPTNSIKETGFALSTTANTLDRLQWEYDGTYYMWTIYKGLQYPTDADAETFLDAGRTNIADVGQRAAINTLVTSLKSASLWTKFYAIYPFIGGTSAQHALNLKGASYDITNSGAWTTGVTHNSNGITGIVASSGCGDTNFNFAAVSNRDDASIYVYSKTSAPTNTGYIFAANSTLGADYTRFGIYASGTQIGIYGPHNQDSGPGANTDVGLNKHLVVQRSSSSLRQSIVNADYRSASSTAVFTAIDDDLFLLARNNNGSTSGYSNANLAMAAIGQALTEAEWTTFRGIVDTYQTALGRANP